MTVSDAILAAIPDGNPDAPPGHGRGARARVRARLAATHRDGNLHARLAGLPGLVAGDVRDAWIWRGQPPTLADLWAARMPVLERVPGEHRALWVGWVVFNHLALVVFALVAPLLWLLGHPARFLLAALLVGPLIGMWIT